MILKILAAWLVLSIPASLFISALIAHGSREPAAAPGGGADVAGDGVAAVCAACGHSSPAATPSSAAAWAVRHRDECAERAPATAIRL